MTIRLSAHCVLIIFISATPSYGELIAYEGFDYADVGGDIRGKDGGMGFRRTWFPTLGKPADKIDIANGSLTFPGLKTEGNHVGSLEPLFPDCEAAARGLDTRISRDETTTKYLSALVRPEGTLGEGPARGVIVVALDGSTDDIVAAGPGREPNYFIERLGDDQTGPRSDVLAVSGETALMVIKAELQPSDDKFTLYVNPIPGAPEPLSGTVLDGVDIGQLNGVYLAGCGASSFDEIRFGDTFADVTPAEQVLQPGDSDQDLDFDQLDLVQVQIAAKYLTGQPATWGQGDWNGAPGGSPSRPPAGDGLFNQLDIVAAQQTGHYLSGPYAALTPQGQRGDHQTSIIYDAITGNVAVDAPPGLELTSINIDSAGGIFSGAAAQNLGGSFDNHADNNIFKATFGGSFGSLSFGTVAPPGIEEDFLLSDLSVVGSLQGGGALGDVDLIYVPETSSIVLLSIGILACAYGLRSRRGQPVHMGACGECVIGPNSLARKSSFTYPVLSVVWAISIVALGHPAYADLLAYEGFDYSDVGGALLEKNGGTGFGSEWHGLNVVGSGSSIVRFHDISEGSLNFRGLETFGNHVTSDRRTGCCKGIFRDLPNPIAHDDIATMYFSFLLRPESLDDWFGLDVGPGIVGQDVFTGYPTNNPPTYLVENLGGARGHWSDFSPVVGETAFFVVRADFADGTDSFTLYANPTPGLPEPQSGIVKADHEMGEVSFVGITSAGVFGIDEIRVGETYADVTPAPALTTTELIRPGDQWDFFAGRAEPSTFPELQWTKPEFTPRFGDANWKTSNGGFGFGADVETRQVMTELQDMRGNYGSLYLRRSFPITNPNDHSDLLLEIDFDDAFIAYINGVEVTRSNIGTPGTPEPFDTRLRSSRRASVPSQFLIDLSPFPELLRVGEDNVLAIQGINRSSSDRDFVLSRIRLMGVSPATVDILQAGDADQDLDFDQLDLVQVQIAGKYLTGQFATWGEGDWNGAPGGNPGNPPPGDGLFNQLDIVAAQQAGAYLTGPYAAIRPNGQANDGQTSIVYNVATGELSVDAPTGTELTSINIDSAAGIFTGDVAENLSGSFDNDVDTNIFKATFGGSFGSLSFGTVARTGLPEAMLLGDLSVVGSLAGGGDLGQVDLVYVPEPSALFLLILGASTLSLLVLPHTGGRAQPVVRSSPNGALTYQPGAERCGDSRGAPPWVRENDTGPSPEMAKQPRRCAFVSPFQGSGFQRPITQGGAPRLSPLRSAPGWLVTAFQADPCQCGSMWAMMGNADQ